MLKTIIGLSKVEWVDGLTLRAPESAIYVFGLALLLLFSCIRRWDGTHLLKYCNEGLFPVFFINIILSLQ